MASSKKQNTTANGAGRSRHDNIAGSGAQTERAASALSPGAEREMYVKRSNELVTLFATMHGIAKAAEVGSDLWLTMTEKVDAAYQTLRRKGDLPLSRLLLLECVDYATSLPHRIPRCNELLRVAEGADEVAARQAEKELHLECALAQRFEAETGLKSIMSPVELATFDFARRCPEYAEAIRSVEAQQALVRVVQSWEAGAGRPKGGQRRSKWADADALMKAVGLTGTTADSLEADWKKHPRKWPRK